MTKDNISNNREQYIKEFKSIGLQGTKQIIRYLDFHHFFEARCNGHDRYPGGTANHSLWVLKFARETRASILNKHPEKNVSKSDLVLACLLHDVCNCNPRPGVHGRRSWEILSQRIKGFTFSQDVLDAVNAHMHSSLYKGGPKSTENSNSTKELLHYLVFNSDHRAIEYGGNIPFGTEPKDIKYEHSLRNKVDILYHNKERRYWYENGYCFNRNKIADFDNMSPIQAFIKAYLYVGQRSNESNIIIMGNEKGLMALFFLQYCAGHGGPIILATDKVGFDYKEIIVYASRYPQYRPSFIMGRKNNGTWDIISVRDRYDVNDGIITTQYLTDYEFDQTHGYIIKKDDGTQKKRYPTRLAHTDFYTSVTIK